MLTTYIDVRDLTYEEALRDRKFGEDGVALVTKEIRSGMLGEDLAV